MVVMTDSEEEVINKKGPCPMLLKITKIIFVAIVLTAMMQTGAAWSAAAESSEKDSKKTGFSFALGDNWRITPYIAPGYTPEMGGLVVGGGLLSFMTSMTDTVSQRSSMPIAFSYSTTGALMAAVILTSFWNEDQIRIQADFTVKDMDDHYYGVGYDAGRYTQQSDSTTAYHRTWGWFNPRLLFKVRQDLYAGVDWDLNYTRATNPGTVMLADPNFQQFGPENFNHGLGLIVQYDSRDVTVNAWRGTYFSGRARFYSEAIGGDNYFQIYDIDYRTYTQLGRPGRTLVLQLRSRIGKGNVPWAELSQPGSPFDLRGYRWGRYRDKSMFYGIMEFRNMFRKSGSEPHGLSPHGVVAWIGGGSIAPEVKDFKDWLPNFGVGYRFEVQPRMNVRLDVGFAQEENGWAPAVYFNFNEAF